MLDGLRGFIKGDPEEKADGGVCEDANPEGGGVGLCGGHVWVVNG